MKKWTYILLCSLLPIYLQAQNHVPNGDFEYYTNCPTATDQASRCIGWSSLIATTTPDYFNACATNISCDVPINVYGFQYPASGNGYMGGVTYHPTNLPFREIITRSIVPLQVGVKYEVSISVSRADYTQYATNSVTILFYDNLSTVTTGNWQYVKPQINFLNSSVAGDTSSWMRLSTTFVADSSYDNIAIGGFLHDSLMTITSTNNQALNIGYAFCYYDSIVVRPMTFIQIGDVDTNLCAGDSITVNYFTGYRLHATNVFTAQLSDQY